MSLMRRESVGSQFVSEVPGLKVKRLTGTTAATEGANVQVPHGMATADKAIGWITSVKFDDNTQVGENETSVINRQFNSFVITDTNFVIVNAAANSAGILSKAFSVILFYTD